MNRSEDDPDVRIVMTSKKTAEDILDPTKPVRSLDDIIKEISEIRDKGSAAVNISDAGRLERLGLELIRHARETMVASY